MKMNSDFFLETDVCLFVKKKKLLSFVRSLSHAHTSRARYYHISLKEFKNTIIEEKELLRIIKVVVCCHDHRVLIEKREIVSSSILKERKRKSPKRGRVVVKKDDERRRWWWLCRHTHPLEGASDARDGRECK